MKRELKKKQGKQDEDILLFPSLTGCLILSLVEWLFLKSVWWAFLAENN